MGFIVFIHSLVCILLATIILMQSGRGGGLTEQFSSAETLFGAKTNSFLVKATGVLATMFLVTCLSLAFLSSRQDRSLMSQHVRAPQEHLPGTLPATPSAPEAPTTATIPDDPTTQVLPAAATPNPVPESSSNSATTDAKESTENANQNTAPQAAPVANSAQ